MVPRDTSTGTVLEEMICPALKHGGYDYKTQVNIGKKPSGKKHIIDVLAEDSNGKEYLISLKWQQVSGTAEEKIPYEIICLIHKMKESQDKFNKAYLVLGGGGFTLRDFYVNGGLEEYIKNINLINIVTLETFVAKANSGNL